MFSTGRTASADLASQSTTDLTLIDGSQQRLPLRFSRKRNTGIFRRASDSAFCVVVDGVIQMYATSSLIHITNYVTSARAGLGTGNTVYGALAGNTTMTGNYNSYYGYRAGISTTTGSRNVLIGYNAAENLTSGLDNIAIGSSVAPVLTTAKNNILIGTGAGASLTSGGCNIVIGSNCMPLANSTNAVVIGRNAATNAAATHGAVILGFEAANSIYNGNYSVYIGYQAGRNTTTATQEVVIGAYAMGGTNTGGVSGSNTVVGYTALYGGYDTYNAVVMGHNAHGYAYITKQLCNNVTIGSRANYLGQTSADSVFIGRLAGYSNVGGQRNVVIGMSSALNCCNVQDGVIIGNQICSTNTNTVTGVVLGSFAASSSVGGVGGVIIGTRACYDVDYDTNYTGSGVGYMIDQVILGDYAGYYLQSDTGTLPSGCNTLIGSYAGTGLCNAHSNVCVGAHTMYYDPGVANIGGTAIGSVCVGTRAGYGAYNSSYSVYLGTRSGYACTGNSNVFLGYYSGSNETATSDTFIVANSATTADELLRGSFSSNLTSRQLTVNGSLTSKATFALDGNLSNSAGHGRRFLLDATTFEDTSTAGSGTASWYSSAKIDQVTVAATNSSVTTTDAASLYIEDAPVAGTNQTLTNAYALYVNSGNTRLGGDVTVTGALTASTVSGSITPSITTVSSTPYTVLTTDENILVDCTSSAITLNLPNISSTPQLLRIKDQLGGAGASNITVNCDASDTIDGGTSVVLNANYTSVTLVSDGVSKWSIV